MSYIVYYIEILRKSLLQKRFVSWEGEERICIVTHINQLHQRVVHFHSMKIRLMELLLMRNP